MKVILKVALAGARGSFVPGDEYTCETKAEGQRLIKAGMAVAVEKPSVGQAVKRAVGIETR